MKKYKRLPNEPKKMYERFLRYLHSNRNLKEFAKNENLSYTTILHNSSNYNWTVRALEYDKEEERKIYNKIDHLFKSLNYQGLKDMKNYINDLNKAKTDTSVKYSNNEISLNIYMHFMKNYIKCYKEATELYYINCRKSIKPVEEINNNMGNPLNNLAKAILESEEKIKHDTDINIK